MSRLPPPSTRSRSPMKPSSGPSKPRQGATTPIRNSTPVRTRTKSAAGRSTPQKPVEKEEPPAVPAMSIKEQIALKRAEAKKAMAARSGGGGLDDMSSLEDAIPGAPAAPPEEDILGRWSVRETIERARSTGSLNLSSRSLQCIPPELYEIHLGITPDPLKSVPSPTPLPPSEPSAAQRRGKKDNPAWFEAQDLQTLKAFSNEILEIQHEISLFGSLKVIDLHNNKLSSLPHSFGDLANLTSLDLSHNALTSLPTNLFTFPELTYLDVSHNLLTSLPFNEPFASGRKFETSGSGFFTPSVNRANSPLPRLATLYVSHNKLSADAIDLVLPSSLVRVDLSSNPLGLNALPLIKKLGSFPALKELRFEKADIGDEAFPKDLTPTTPFLKLRILDLGETRASPEGVQAALQGLGREVDFQPTTEEPPEGVLQVTVGKKVYKEPWEIEAERKAKARAARLVHEEGINWGSRSGTGSGGKTGAAPAEKEPWEIEAEQGMLTEGAKRRLRAQAANAAATGTGSQNSSSSSKPTQKAEVTKEAWEIEAEQGLLTEGGRRRARAQAAAAAAASSSNSTSSVAKKAPGGLGLGEPSSPTSPPAQSPSSTFSLSNPQYYNQSTQTLTLPSSTPPSKVHSRAFSMAPKVSSISPSGSTSDLAVPVPSAPFAEIAAESFSANLRVLILSNRRKDRSLTLPASFGSALLPNLEELDLEGCNFPDMVSVCRIDPAAGDNDGLSPTRTTEPLIPLIANLFPRLLSLNLSYNMFSSSQLTTENLSALVLAAPHKKGLKRLGLRGNKFSELDGFIGLSEMFKGNREIPGWKLDELDLRDNEVPRLPAEMGLLPLEVFLVDGNPFRVPPRRIWEREGTKGLLSWLRSRIE